MVDASGPEEAIRDAIRAVAEKVDSQNQELLILLNKCDILGDNKNVNTFNSFVLSISNKLNSENTLEISAKTGSGLEKLRDVLVSRSGIAAATGTLVTNARHAAALRDAASFLAAVSDGLDRAVPSDLLAEDLRAALASLGTITGEITTDEVLVEIFSRFCIGK